MKIRSLLRKGDLFSVLWHFGGGDRIEWSMEKREFWRAFAGWSCVMAFALYLVFSSLTVCGEGGKPDLTVRREGEGLWRFRLSPSLAERVGDDPMALLMEIDPSGGWQVREIRKGKGAEGFVLTHGDLHADRVRVLLDGILSEGELLWVETEQNPAEAPEERGYMGVTGADGGEVILYVLREGGEVERIPLSVAVEERETEGETAEEVTDGESESSEDPPAETEAASEAVTEPTDTESESPPAESSEETGGQDGEPPPQPQFLGCRETGITDGRYTAQFLFAGKETPVVCMAGGGVLTVTCGTAKPLTKDGEVWYTCAFSGLLAGRRYVFWVGTAKGWVTAVYEDGKFVGYGQDTAMGYSEKVHFRS